MIDSLLCKITSYGNFMKAAQYLSSEEITLYLDKELYNTEILLLGYTALLQNPQISIFNKILPIIPIKIDPRWKKSSYLLEEYQSSAIINFLQILPQDISTKIKNDLLSYTIQRPPIIFSDSRITEDQGFYSIVFLLKGEGSWCLFKGLDPYDSLCKEIL